MEAQYLWISIKYFLILHNGGTIFVAGYQIFSDIALWRHNIYGKESNIFWHCAMEAQSLWQGIKYFLILHHRGTIFLGSYQIFFDIALKRHKICGKVSNIFWYCSMEAQYLWTSIKYFLILHYRSTIFVAKYQIFSDIALWTVEAQYGPFQAGEWTSWCMTH